MTKARPIDLIVANVMHGAVEAAGSADYMVELLTKAGLPAQKHPDIHAEVARKLLCEIAHDASIGKIYAALKAVGAPCSADDIKEGMRAVEERAG